MPNRDANPTGGIPSTVDVDDPTDMPPPRTIKTVTGGVLMGIANLIPGVSGGTMILAMGLYTEFIDSVADLTAFRFRRRPILFLAKVGIGAIASILLLAGVILDLLFHYPIAMYALFIGMTLGGAPLLAKSLKPVRLDVIVATIAGFGLMIAVVMLKTGGGLPHNTGMDLVSGVVGSTTMVLPGISGSYMLLVMDQYDRVIGAVHDLKQALQTQDMDALKSALWIVIPVGIGAVAGIVALSNLLKYLLHRRPRVTVGLLLGVLLGSVVGLWPFGKIPSNDALEKRSTEELVQFAESSGISIEAGASAEAIVLEIRDQWADRAYDDMTPANILLAGVLIAAGFLLTFWLSSRGTELRTGN